MGVPRLTAVLEPFAHQKSLNDQSLIIDGPGFAYHMHYLCKRGANYPSYEELGKTSIDWLDSLTKHRITAKAIYFDGYLPSNKLGTRISRHLRSTNQLSENFSHAPDGLPISWLSSRIRSSPEVNEQISKTHRLTPTFLVPAVLEALQKSSRYQAVVSVVSAEADIACAQHVAENGGIVVTSDSDLLVHDLGDGSVAFLKDFNMDASKCMAKIYTPKDICRRIGVDSPHRLGYEVFLSRHSSLSQLSQACKGPIVDEISYNEFCKEYLEHETAYAKPLLAEKTRALSRLDPRIAEIVHQLRSRTSDTPRVFLPILLESPEKGASWEPTTAFRQVAYSLCNLVFPQSTNTVFEYRRVQTPDHKGRGVLLLHKSGISEIIDPLLKICTWVRAQVSTEMYWFTLFMTLNIRECQAQGKQSHVLRILESEPQLQNGKVAWDLIHFTACIKACYYSLRMLHQVLSLAADGTWENISPEILRMKQELKGLPSLSNLPPILKILELLRESQNSEFVPALREVMGMTREAPQKANVSKVQKKKNKGKKKGAAGSGAEQARTNNLFSLLEED